MTRYTVFFLLLLVFPISAISGEKKDAVAARIDPDGVQRIEITGGSYFFRPERISVKANVPVELTVKKEPSMTPHDFVLKAAEAGVDISVDLSSTPKVVSFTPMAKGTYNFYCDKRFLFFKSHRARGMEGTIEVIE